MEGGLHALEALVGSSGLLYRIKLTLSYLLRPFIHLFLFFVVALRPAKRATQVATHLFPKLELKFRRDDRVTLVGARVDHALSDLVV